MKKVFLIVSTALVLAACAELETGLEVMDAIATPTDREVCEHKIHGGKWIDGACYSKGYDFKKMCAGGVFKDSVCYHPDGKSQ